MPRGPAPAWRARKPPVTDDWIMASVERAGGLGAHNPTTGHYGTLHISGLESREEAAEYRQSLFRCAHYLARHGIADVSMSARILKDGAGFVVEFSAIDKTHARAHVLAKHGPDRSKWPYDPRRRNM